MKKPKFKVGQIVHVAADYYNKSKLIKGIRVIQQFNQTDKSSKTHTTVEYLIKLNHYNQYYLENILFGSNSDFYVKKRKKDKSAARASITRVKKSLTKNKQKLANLQKKLQAIKE